MAAENVNKVVLLLGTNMGNRMQNINEALTHISGKIGDIEKQSSLYKTDAWGNTSQDYFINRALIISTHLSAIQVLAQIQTIEKLMGRERGTKWEPRIIDIDILFFNNQIIKLPFLQIPHPEFANRKFAILPLMEINPKLKHPVLQLNIEEILDKCTDTLAVKIIKNSYA